MPSDSKPARRIGRTALLLAFALAPAVDAQPAQMVRDIATVPFETPPTLIAIPNRTVELEGVHYLVTSDGVHGRELWRTDGTAAGTWMVKDICPGQCHSGWGYDVEVHDGALYLVADDGVHGRELWRSDGTAAGTEMVADVVPGPVGSSPESLTRALGTLFFSAYDSVHGRELWKSDGTTAGTVLVKDIYELGASYPTGLREVGGWLLFGAFDGLNGRQLWRSNGESAGTERVLATSGGLDVAAEQGTSRYVYSDLLDERLVLSAHDDLHGWEAWITDGTDTGTELIADLNPGPADGALLFFTRMGNAVYFVGEGPDPGFARELWKTDGTEAGTVRVADVRPGPEGSNPSGFTVVGSSLFFAATGSEAVGRELWVTDGTELGTRLVRDIGPGSDSGLAWVGLYGMNEVGGRLFFNADDGIHGLEPWVSDGTEAGTVPLADVNPGPGWAFDPFSLAFLASEVGAEALFFAFDPVSGWEPWMSDGTPEGTRRLAILDGQVSAVPENLRMHRTSLADVGGTLYFGAEENVHGAELWLSDGTVTGTEMVADIDPDPFFLLETELPGGSSPQDLTALDGKVVFVANDARGREPWVSDGTEAGTELLADLASGSDSSYPRHLARFGDRALFSADDGVSYAVYGTSGIPGEVDLLSHGIGLDFAPAAGAYFYRTGNGALVRTLGEPGTSSAVVPDGVAEIAGAGDWLYFVRDGELWRTDGTPGATAQLSAFAPAPGVRRAGGSLDGPPLAGVPATGSALFFADDGVHGLEPWWSDGTPEGTRMLADVRPGPESSWPRRPVTAGRQVFLWADDGTEGVEPWVSDGTEEGTRRTADLQPGAGSSFTATWESATVALFGELFFAAYRAGEGVELWRSDGTEAGTTLFQDVNPGPGSSSPDNMTLSNGRMFFTASDGVHGFELWAAPMAPPGVRLLLSASGGLFPGGTVIYTLILENTGDFALLAGPENEIELPIPPGLTVVSIAADQGTVELPTSGDRLLWDGGLPPRGVVTLEVRALVGDLPLGTEIVAHASAFFDTTGDGVAEPPVASDDPGTEQTGDATRIVLAAAPPAIPVLSLPGLLALAGLLAAAAGRLLRRRAQPAPPGSGSSPSSTSR